MIGEDPGPPGPDGSLHERAAADPHGFWAAAARELSLFEPFEHVLEGDPPVSRWFTGARLNASYVCVDRHVEAGLGARTAFLVDKGREGTRTVSYAELLAEVSRFANALHGLGVERGDVVAIQLPELLELPVAMLASARIGAAHLVVPVDAPAGLLRACIDDAGASVLVSSGEPVDSQVSVTSLHAGSGEGAARSWDELVAGEPAHCPPEAMEAEELFHLRYVTRPTGRLLGLEHATAGYLAEVAFHSRYAFELDPGRDVQLCSAPLTSAAGHAYGVYGPLGNAMTSVLGAPGRGEIGRLFELVERHGVTVFSCAAGDVGLLARNDAEATAGHDLSRLRMLVAIGERLDRAAWDALSRWKGAGCRAVLAYMTEETGAVLAATPPEPCAPAAEEGREPALAVLPGISLEVVDDRGQPVRLGAGHLAVSRPWPAMPRRVHGDPGAYREEYWTRFGGRFSTGSDAEVDAGGGLRLLERGTTASREA